MMTEDEERAYAVDSAKRHVEMNGRSRTVQVLLPFDEPMIYDLRPAPDEDKRDLSQATVRIATVHFDHHGEITRIYIPPRDPDAHL